MLYLIRSFGRGNKSALKVGFTNSPVSRHNSYYIHNPFYEPISQRQGNEEDELRLHLYLEALGYKTAFLNEWFVDDPGVLQEFHASFFRADKVIWRNRDILFSPNDFKEGGNILRRNLYEALKGRFKTTTQSLIDTSYSREQARKVIRDWKRKEDEAFIGRGWLRDMLR